MNATEKIRELMFTLLHGKSAFQSHRDEFNKRKMVVTDFDGSYGNAGTIIVIEGTPPHGTIISFESRNNGEYIPPNIFYIVDCKSRRLNDKQASIVREFLRKPL